MRASPVASSPNKPFRHVTLSPNAFASDWSERPETDVAIGLRFVSVEDVETAQNIAVKRARDWIAPEGRVLDKRSFDEVRNDQLISILVARASCDPNDVGVPYFGAVADEVIRQRLTVTGIRRLWDEMCAMHVTCGVGMPQADDDEVKMLAAILARGSALEKAEPGVAHEIRRLAAYALEHLGPLDDGAATEDDSDEAEDGVYAAAGALA
jgi:hypothetical protein